MKELKFEELSLEQKLGMVHTAFLGGTIEENMVEYVLDQIKNHALGAVWIQQSDANPEEMLKKVKEVADYPILIITDAESGIEPYVIGRHNALGCTGSEAHAYAFGKSVAVTARKMGYNVVCNPLLDISTTGSVRSLGSDKYKVAKLAAAEARGMHDGGVLTVGKHYPSGNNPKEIDSHMAESVSEQTEEELLDYSLYAYLELMKENLLDGVMTSHKRFVNIDPSAPASLSKKMIDIIREKGFDGFAITDALCMMGIRAKFGDVEAKGLAVAAGNDLVLPYERVGQDFHRAALHTCYENGIFSEERLNEAVKRVLAAQHKVMLLQKDAELTEADIQLVQSINKDGVYAKVDEGLSVSVPRDGKHFFALMIRNESAVVGSGVEVEVDTFNTGWLYPTQVIQKIQTLFPNSKVEVFHQFPTPSQNMHILGDSVGYDDVIFLTFTEPKAYTGKEYLTHRVVTLITAMQYTERISTVVHFGNPFVLEELPHIPRYLLGGLSADSINACLEVLAGEYPANGKLTYDVHLN